LSEPIWGTAYQAFGGGEKGERACRALGALAAVGQIDTTIANFLVPLQVFFFLAFFLARFLGFLLSCFVF
jgi:hypothetical protein